MLKAEKEQIQATIADLKSKVEELHQKAIEAEADTDTFLRKLADHPATLVIVSAVSGTILGGLTAFFFIVC
jgi:ElaB/YqjD/DUF883 family membrane-anchored ribosome-binding protein